MLLVKRNNFPRRPPLELWCQRRSSPFLAETRQFQRWQLNACKLATCTSILQSKQSPQLTLTHASKHTTTGVTALRLLCFLNLSFISSKNSIVPSKNKKKKENGKDLQLKYTAQKIIYIIYMSKKQHEEKPSSRALRNWGGSRPRFRFPKTGPNHLL